PLKGLRHRAERANIEASRSSRARRDAAEHPLRKCRGGWIVVPPVVSGNHPRESSTAQPRGCGIRSTHRLRLRPASATTSRNSRLGGSWSSAGGYPTVSVEPTVHASHGRYLT